MSLLVLSLPYVLAGNIYFGIVGQPYALRFVIFVINLFGLEGRILFLSVPQL